MYRIILCSLVLFTSTACALGVVQRGALTPAPPAETGTTAVPPTSTVSAPVPAEATEPEPTTPPESGPVPTPEQIRFSPGATSATVEGSLDSCGDMDSYRLDAMEGQTMQVTLTRG
jgi:hypothetical protein